MRCWVSSDAFRRSARRRDDDLRHRDAGTPAASNNQNRTGSGGEGAVDEQSCDGSGHQSYSAKSSVKAKAEFALSTVNVGAYVRGGAADDTAGVISGFVGDQRPDHDAGYVEGGDQ